MGVRTIDMLQERLKQLHDTYGLSWREIARLEEFGGSPAGTLNAIAHGWRPKRGGKVWKRLGLGREKRLYELPVDRLREMLEKRQEVA